VRGRFAFGDVPAEVEGFLLHHGRMLDAGEPMLRLDDGELEGCRRGAIFATMVHRLFDHASARAALLEQLRQRRSLPPPSAADPSGDPYDRLASQLRSALDWPTLARLAGR
jgi:adenosylcobyric acid synthase